MQSLTSLSFVIIITIYFVFIINTENTQTVLPQRLAFQMLGGGRGGGGIRILLHAFITNFFATKNPLYGYH